MVKHHVASKSFLAVELTSMMSQYYVIKINDSWKY